jgi:hypothetical protein
MSEANHIPDAEKMVATNGEAVRSGGWVAELETALTHAERAMSGAMKALDFAVWDEIEDAVDCLRAAVESNRRRSATAGDERQPPRPVRPIGGQP